MEGRKKKKGSVPGKRQKLTKRTLELLSQKLDEFYFSMNNPSYKGVRLSLIDIGMMFEIGKSLMSKLYAEWEEDPTFFQRINR